jgi:GDPmannose 4,6-dehydratase
MQRSALVFGALGQDGLLLSELLVARGYAVFGTASPGSDPKTLEVPGVKDLLVDLSSQASIEAALRDCAPNEVYNLTSISKSPGGWDEPRATFEGGLRPVVVLEAIRSVDPATRFFQASSSEMFGEPDASPQNELTPLRPVSPYGAARAYGHLIVGAFRRRYGLFACSGVLYNHESSLRPERFVSRKISRGAAAIALGLQDKLTLGSLDAQRDWTFAGDVVHAAWLMLQHDRPDDYIVSSGVPHSVRELVDWAFQRVGLDWQAHVETADQLVRGSAELQGLVGDSTKLRSQLGWHPSMDARAMIESMVDHDVRLLAPGDRREQPRSAVRRDVLRFSGGSSAP